LEVMRSEQPGEDVDGDGISGETQQVQVRVQSGTNQYSFGPFFSPTNAATCTNGNVDTVALTLNDASLLTVWPCCITGRVVYSGISMGGATPTIPVGGGIRFAKVVAYDPEALDVAMASCSNCLVTTADSLGYFSLEIPVLAGVSLSTLTPAHSFIS